MWNNILNLIRKDFCSLWNEKLSACMFVAMLVISAVFASSPSFSSLVFVFFTASSYILNVFSLEEKFRTERFFASLPVRRRDIVLARYGGILAIAGAYFVVAYLANAVSIFVGSEWEHKLLGKTVVRPIPLGYCTSVLVILALISSFTFPLYFKLGLAKAKTILSLFLMVFMALSGVLLISRPSGGSNRVMKAIAAVLNSPFPHDLPHALLVMGVAILLWGVSIPLAVALYSRKDL